METTDDIKEIVVHYEDGTQKSITKGVCVDLASCHQNEISVDMVDMPPKELVMLTMGLAEVCERLGLFGEPEEGAAYEEN